MSVETQINRIKANIASAYAKAAEKGAALPVSQNSENLPETIAGRAQAEKAEDDEA